MPAIERSDSAAITGLSVLPKAAMGSRLQREVESVSPFVPGDLPFGAVPDRAELARRIGPRPASRRQGSSATRRGRHGGARWQSTRRAAITRATLKPDAQPGIAAGPTHGLIAAGRDGVHSREADVRNGDEEDELPGNRAIDGKRHDDDRQQHERRCRQVRERPCLSPWHVAALRAPGRPAAREADRRPSPRRS